MAEKERLKEGPITTYAGFASSSRSLVWKEENWGQFRILPCDEPGDSCPDRDRLAEKNPCRHPDGPIHDPLNHSNNGALLCPRQRGPLEVVSTNHK